MRAPAFSIYRQLLRDRTLASVVIAKGVSSVGDWLYLTVLPLFVFRATGDAALVGIVGAARLLPWLLLSIPAGMLVDRLPGPRLLVVADGTRAGLMFVLAALAMAGGPVEAMLAVAMLAVVAGTVAMPAHGRLIPELAGSQEELAAANVVAATLDNLACLVGPAIAAILLLLDHIELAFVMNGLSFIGIVGVLIRFQRPRTRGTGDATPQEPEPRQAGNPIIEIVRDAADRLTMDAAVSFAAGALWVLPVLLASMSGMGEWTVGILGVGAGVGGIAGAAAAGLFVHRRAFRGMVYGVVGTALGIAGTALGPSPVIAILAITAASAAVVTLDTVNTTELQRTTPPGRLGRTLGILHTTASASAMAGSALPAIAVGWTGIGGASLLVGAIVLVIGMTALAGPQIQGLARLGSLRRIVDARSGAAPRLRRSQLPDSTA